MWREPVQRHSYWLSEQAFIFTPVFAPNSFPWTVDPRPEPISGRPLNPTLWNCVWENSRIKGVLGISSIYNAASQPDWMAPSHLIETPSSIKGIYSTKSLPYSKDPRNEADFLSHPGAKAFYLITMLARFIHTIALHDKPDGDYSSTTKLMRITLHDKADAY